MNYLVTHFPFFPVVNRVFKIKVKVKYPILTHSFVIDEKEKM